MGDTAIADPPRKSGRGSGLVPFDSESAKIAAAKSAETRRAQAEERKRLQRTAAKSLAALRDTYDRNDLGEFSALMVMDTMQKVLTGQIELRNGSEAAAFIRECHQIHRLETGQATSHSAHLSMTTAEAIERFQNVRQDAAGDTESPADDA